jgi:hypothetical protein
MNYTRLSHFNHVIIKSANDQTPVLSAQLPAKGEGLLVKDIYNTANKTKTEKKTRDILG